MSVPTWVPWGITFVIMSQTLCAAPLRLIRGFEYAESAGGPRRFDAYLPSSSTPTPAAIIVHGGGWVGGDRRTNVEPLCTNSLLSYSGIGIDTT